jgi:hypothetical protein
MIVTVITVVSVVQNIHHPRIICDSAVTDVEAYMKSYRNTIRVSTMPLPQVLEFDRKKQTSKNMRH